MTLLRTYPSKSNTKETIVNFGLGLLKAAVLQMKTG
jgi:hypothetical protein